MEKMWIIVFVIALVPKLEVNAETQVPSKKEKIELSKLTTLPQTQKVTKNNQENNLDMYFPKLPEMKPRKFIVDDMFPDFPSSNFKNMFDDPFKNDFKLFDYKSNYPDWSAMSNFDPFEILKENIDKLDKIESFDVKPTNKSSTNEIIDISGADIASQLLKTLFEIHGNIYDNIENDEDISKVFKTLSAEHNNQVENKNPIQEIEEIVIFPADIPQNNKIDFLGSSFNNDLISQVMKSFDTNNFEGLEFFNMIKPLLFEDALGDNKDDIYALLENVRDEFGNEQMLRAFIQFLEDYKNGLVELEPFEKPGEEIIIANIFDRVTRFSVLITEENTTYYIPSDAKVTFNPENKKVYITWGKPESLNSLVLSVTGKQNRYITHVFLHLVKGKNFTDYDKDVFVSSTPHLKMGSIVLSKKIDLTNKVTIKFSTTSFLNNDEPEIISNKTIGSPFLLSFAFALLVLAFALLTIIISGILYVKKKYRTERKDSLAGLKESFA